jgi:hypothetical protein
MRSFIESLSRYLSTKTNILVAERIYFVPSADPFPRASLTNKYNKPVTFNITAHNAFISTH